MVSRKQRTCVQMWAACVTLLTIVNIFNGRDVVVSPDATRKRSPRETVGDTEDSLIAALSNVNNGVSAPYSGIVPFGEVGEPTAPSARINPGKSDPSPVSYTDKELDALIASFEEVGETESTVPSVHIKHATSDPGPVSSGSEKADANGGPHHSFIVSFEEMDDGPPMEPSANDNNKPLGMDEAEPSPVESAAAGVNGAADDAFASTAFTTAHASDKASSLDLSVQGGVLKDALRVEEHTAAAVKHNTLSSSSLSLAQVPSKVASNLEPVQEEMANTEGAPGPPQLVYRCGNKDWCAGWSNRLMGMVSLAFIAEHTGRVFRVHSSKPLPLDTWLSLRSGDDTNDPPMYLTAAEAAALDIERHQKTSFNSGGVTASMVHKAVDNKPHTVVMTTNLNLHGTLCRSFYEAPYATPGSTKKCPLWSDMVYNFFEKHVRLQPPVQKAVDKFLADVNTPVYRRRRLHSMKIESSESRDDEDEVDGAAQEGLLEPEVICAQVRMGDGSFGKCDDVAASRHKTVSIALNWLQNQIGFAASKTGAPLPRVVLLSDNEGVRRHIRSKISPEMWVEIPGELAHIDQGTITNKCSNNASKTTEKSGATHTKSSKRDDTIAAHVKTLTDFWAVSRCDRMLIDERSEFGVTAYMLNRRPNRTAAMLRRNRRIIKFDNRKYPL